MSSFTCRSDILWECENFYGQEVVEFGAGI